jgi:replicative DNA helicase
MAARRLQASGGIDLLVVDYLQLLCAGDDSKEAVTVVSKGLKAIAKDLHIPVLAVTQLSRQIEYRDDKRPKLSDIRGSGQIEQDADAVLFIWNPSKTKVEVFIEKNRNGPLGATTLTFDKDTTKFSSGGW